MHHGLFAAVLGLNFKMLFLVLAGGMRNSGGTSKEGVKPAFDLGLGYTAQRSKAYIY